MRFRDLLQQRTVVTDGAMGTMLAARGMSVDACLDELNLTAPQLVMEIHREYLAAGAEIIGSNTFGANRARLGKFGLAGKTDAINRAGMKLARQAADSPDHPSFVAGVMGPSGLDGEAEARAVFREQAMVLCSEGADLLLLETFTNLHELREAILAAREVSGRETAMVAHVAVSDSGDLIGGETALAFIRQANQWPVDAVGFNCSNGPRATLQALETVAAHSKKHLSAIPSAGLPLRVGGQLIYSCSPEIMAQYSRRMVEAGARMIGGCCGTTPEHIKQMVAANL